MVLRALTYTSGDPPELALSHIADGAPCADLFRGCTFMLDFRRNRIAVLTQQADYIVDIPSSSAMKSMQHGKPPSAHIRLGKLEMVALLSFFWDKAKVTMDCSEPHADTESILRPAGPYRSAFFSAARTTAHRSGIALIFLERFVPTGRTAPSDHR